MRRQRRGLAASASALAAGAWLASLATPAARSQPREPERPAEAPPASISAQPQAGDIHATLSLRSPGLAPPTADLQPTDWAYQQLRQLQEQGACTESSLSPSLRDRSPISRFEAAALLSRCLPPPGSETDEQKALIESFRAELVRLRAGTDTLRARLVDLQALTFSPTTRLSGNTTFVLGGNHFGGSATKLVNNSRQDYGGTTFNYDLKLNLDSSFTGKDLLRIRLRAGNFDRTSNSFYVAGPTPLSQLEVAFQEKTGPDIVAVNRLYYQFPLGEFTFTFGAKVGQENMLAIWPSVYPASSVLDVLTFAGAIGAQNLSLGTGAGLWWQRNGFAISLNTIAANGPTGDPQRGGIGSAGAGTSSSLQIGYSGKQWALTAIYSWLQNGFGTIPYGTELVLRSFEAPGSTSAYGLSGYWQPLTSRWIPSISAGYGYNTTRYEQGSTGGLVGTSQSWSVGVQWLNVLAKGHSLGFSFGQPTYAIRLIDGSTTDDGNWVWEGWYDLALNDHVSITPAVFYLSRPLGADTPAGRSFQQLGLLIKTNLRF